jgi:TolB protein
MTQPQLLARLSLSQVAAIIFLGILLLLSTACSSPDVPDITPTSGPAPTPTLSSPSPTPTPLGGASFAVYQTDRDGNWEIYLLDLASWQEYNLTQHPAEDRNPALSPDGTRLAFESHRDGNWDVYLLHLESGEATRLTQELGFDGAPTWSPDGSLIAFESYRDGNWEIYLLELEARQVSRLTADPAGDYAPAWSPDGELIAFTSWRDGDKEVYVMDVDGSNPRNLSNVEGDDEYPAWSPDGKKLAFVSSRDDGHTTEIYLMEVGAQDQIRLTNNDVNDWDPAWYPDGKEIIFSSYNKGDPFEVYHEYRSGHYDLNTINVQAGEATALELSSVHERNPTMASALLPLGDRQPAPQPVTPTPVLVSSPEENDGLYELVELPGVTGGNARLNDRVDDSYNALRSAVHERTGYDYLALLSDATRRLDFQRTNYSYFSWHKTGRAFDLRFELLDENGGQRLEWLREDIGEELYWRLLIKCAAQDGTQGEPLKIHPWQYWWNIVPDSDPESYAQGGRYLPVPDGYYEDLTALAERYDWERIASYDQEDYNWRRDSNGVEYWHYQHMDGLTWYESMQEIHPQEVLDQYFTWEIGKERGFSDELLERKGVPRPEGT